MSRKLKIFFYPLEGMGHINACIGMGQVLAQRGHEIHFIVNQKLFCGQFETFGFKEIHMYSGAGIEEKSLENDSYHPLKEMEFLSEMLNGMGLFSKSNSTEKLISMSNVKEEENFLKKNYDDLKEINPRLNHLLREEKPDLIIVDRFLVPPCIAYGQIPWALLMSSNPTFLFLSDDLPPCMSGFPSNDRTGWTEFTTLFHNTFAKMIRTLQNSLNREFGYPEVDPRQFLFVSKFMNIYGYPEELDYLDVIRLPENYVRVDAFIRNEPVPFELPEDFKAKIQPGDKLIYVSLGSMGSMDVVLMKVLVEELKHSPHKYIFSKGALGEKYELADNMWGLPYLPQTKVLPLVDMVVTHGGNNTVTETFSFGKPMLVMPLFADQYDNAQRITEKGYGLRMNPYDFQDGDLRQAIDQILNDESLLERCQKASKRMAKSQSKQKACIQIEKMLESHSSDH